jgi:hypothetical protein
MNKPSWPVLKNALTAWWETPDRARQGERFGLGVAVATAVMSALALYRGNESRMEALALISASLLSLALVLPDVLFVPAWALEELFKLSTRALMYVLLAVIFLLVFTPVGIALRLLGKDPLDRKLDPGASSYWIERQPKDPKRVERQF